MAPTQPVLASNNLPHPAPDGYRETVEFRGASTEMADGTVVYDLVNSTAKHVFILKWQNLTTTQRGTVETAWAAIKSSYSASNYTAPTGTSYTVTRDPGQRTLDWQAQIVAGGTLRWSGELRLREV